MVTMPARGLLRVEEMAVDHDLEDPTSGWDQRYVFDVVLELLQQPLRQTDGSRCVASLSAVLDRDLHDVNLLSGYPYMRRYMRRSSN